jgi:hypothetical protein
LIRPNGLFLALALVLAIAATLFGVLAVPSEDHAKSRAGHDEHATHVAAHEGEAHEEDVLDAAEGLAALAVSVLAVALAAIGFRSTRSVSPPGALRFTVAVASACAATIHFAVIDQHFAEYVLFGVFFVVVALAQLGWVVAVVCSSTRRVYLIGALGNALIAVTWIISRTTGLPLGPEAGEPEPLGIADVISTAFEFAIVVGSLLLLRGLGRRLVEVRFVRPAVAIAAIVLTTLSLAGLAGL